MTRHFLKYIAIFVLLPFLALHALLGTTPRAQMNARDERVVPRTLQTEIPKLMQEWRLPAISIALIQSGEIAWHRAFGVRNIQAREKVNDRTIFTAASLTKPVFAYTVLQLCDEGLLDLDRPLVTYAPKEYIEEKFLRHPMDLAGFKADWFSRITARMALSHSSGLQHFGLKEPVEFLYEPGKQFYYSSNGIEYLRYIIEHLTESSIDSIVDRYVFEPLDMTRSSLVWRDEYSPNAAAGHDEYGETSGSIERFKEPTAQASLYTNAHDYGKFLSAVMQGKGLTKAMFNAMITPQIEITPNLYWGLGFGIEQTTEGKGIWHWGDAGTYTSYLYANIDRATGFVYFSNSHYGLAILDELFSLTAPGGHPALSLTIGNWSFAEDYFSPAMAFKCKFFNGDLDEALAYYAETARTHTDGKRFIAEDRLKRWEKELLRHDRIRDAMMVLQLRLEAYHPEEQDRVVLGYIQAAAQVTEDTDLAWTVEMIRAKRNPVPVAEEVLRSYIGKYDPYQITYEENSLYFGREGAGKIKMIPISVDTFLFEEYDHLKIQMLKEKDRVVGFKGIFSTGDVKVYERSDP